MFEFTNTKLSGTVRRGLHAVAVDEQRADFTPTLWDADDRVTQMLFPGAHSDVGGGYPSRTGERSLSDGALRWMMDELAAMQVRFATELPFVPRPDPGAVAHQPWRHVPFESLPRAARAFSVSVSVHPSVRNA